MVDRDREVAHFVPVPFWSLEVLLAANDQTSMGHWRPACDITDDEGRFRIAINNSHAC